VGGISKPIRHLFRSPRTGEAVRAAVRHVSERPWVILDTECERGEVFLLLMNVGVEPAYDVHTQFDRELAGLDREHPVSKRKIFQKMPLMRPGREIAVFYQAARLLFSENKEPLRFRATVTYRDVQGQAYREVFEHDLEVYRDLPHTIRR